MKTGNFGMKAQSMTAGVWALLILLSVLWGGSFFFVELALVGLGPITLVTGRVGLGALALLIFVYATGNRMPSSAGLWGAFVVMGALNNLIPFSLIAWGQVHIDSGLAAILNATTPLFTVLLAHFLTTDERMTAGKLLGVVFGLIGVTVLIGPDALSGLGASGIGQIAVLIAAFSYGCAGIFGRRFKDIPSSVAAAGMLTTSAIMAVPLALLIERPWTAGPGVVAILSVLALAILCTAVAYLLYFHILARAGATNLLLVTFLLPVSALILGIAFLGERPHWTAFAGMGLIFLGLAAVDGRIVRLLRPATGAPEIAAASNSGDNSGQASPPS